MILKIQCKEARLQSKFYAKDIFILKIQKLYILYEDYMLITLV